MKVIEFQNNDIEELQKRVQRIRYELVDHRLELYGVPTKKNPLMIPQVRMLAN